MHACMQSHGSMEQGEIVVNCVWEYSIKRKLFIAIHSNKGTGKYGLYGIQHMVTLMCALMSRMFCTNGK